MPSPSLRPDRRPTAASAQPRARGAVAERRSECPPELRTGAGEAEAPSTVGSLPGVAGDGARAPWRHETSALSDCAPRSTPTHACSPDPRAASRPARDLVFAAVTALTVLVPLAQRLRPGRRWRLDRCRGPDRASGPRPPSVSAGRHRSGGPTGTAPDGAARWSRSRSPAPAAATGGAPVTGQPAPPSTSARPCSTSQVVGVTILPGPFQVARRGSDAATDAGGLPVADLGGVP